jgi:hypothetical protein
MRERRRPHHKILGWPIERDGQVAVDCFLELADSLFFRIALS